MKENKKDKILIIVFTLGGFLWFIMANGSYSKILIGCCLIIIGTVCLLSNNKTKADNKKD